MKLSIGLRKLDTHAHFTLFVNGAKAGNLCMRTDEFREFRGFKELNNREQNYRATLGRIEQLARNWQDCGCEGGRNSCIDRINMIQQLAIDALRPEGIETAEQLGIINHENSAK